MLTTCDVFPGLRISSHRRIAAVRHILGHGVPTLVLIRDPWEAVSSGIVRFGFPARRALLEYRDFTRAWRPIRVRY